MAREHELKTLAPYWDAVYSKEKPFEVRRDDRGFQKGDTLVLCRMNERRPENYDHYDSGGRKEIRVKVLYVLTGGQLGIEPGYVVMGIKHL